MAKNDTARIQLGDVGEALGLLTRLPVHTDGVRGVKAAWAWPLAGAIVAFLSGVIGWICVAIGLTPGVTAAIILCALVVMTGAMHEDGLADCADGFWGGFDVTRRLEIMKDSQIGTYGVVALTFSLLVRWSALATLVSAGWILAPLIAIAALSRVPMIGLMHWLPSARPKGLSDKTGVPDRDTLVIASVIALLLALFTIGFPSFLVAVVVAVAALATALVAQGKIGGQTGDVLGATQQIAEISALVVLAAIAT